MIANRVLAVDRIIDGKLPRSEKVALGDPPGLDQANIDTVHHMMKVSQMSTMYWLLSSLNSFDMSNGPASKKATTKKVTSITSFMFQIILFFIFIFYQGIHM